MFLLYSLKTWRFHRISESQFSHKINTFSDENVYRNIRISILVILFPSEVLYKLFTIVEYQVESYNSYAMCCLKMAYI